MSEVSSLYMQVPISEESFQKFMSSIPSLIESFDDWEEGMHVDKLHLENYVRDYPYTTIGEFIQSWLDSIHQHKAYASSDYNADKQEWIFSIIFFEENRGEMIKTIAPLRGVTRFMDIGDGYLVVYPFFWRYSFIDVSMILNTSHSYFSKIPHRHLQDVDQYLKGKWEEFDAKDEDD